jgi:S-DNA-T family DNA segregation ATPase FtsK/SpoIIIE
LNAQLIEDALRNFGIEVERGEIKTGPSVTQYSFRPAVGVKIAKILALQNDLSLALAAPIRIEAPIPGKSLIGIEVPNKSSSFVRLRSILESKDFKNRKSNLSIALGEDVSGNYIFGSLDKMPHLMVAGATGTGKSVCVNSIITMLLYQNSPEDLKFIMVDPKRVELSLYNGIAHLLTPVIVENAKVVNTLKWAVSEMEKRYKLFQEAGVRDIISFKEKLKRGEKRKLVDAETGEVSEEDYSNIPYIVIVVDELADLMGSHGKEVEGAIVRIAQMARAVGIHLIVSTQRPSVEVITGLIKANITTRISFQVATQIDSRTILDMAGAEKLLGNGDSLYLSANSPKPQRIQGVFVTEKEVKEIVNFIKEENESKDITEDDAEEITAGKSISTATELDNFNGFSDENNDDLYEAAKKEILQSKKASASFLQRRLRVGYARAARLLDILEEKGVVGPSDGAKPREIYGLPEEVGTVYNDDVSDQEKRDKWEM